MIVHMDPLIHKDHLTNRFIKYPDLQTKSTILDMGIQIQNHYLRPGAGELFRYMWFTGGKDAILRRYLDLIAQHTEEYDIIDTVFGLMNNVNHGKLIFVDSNPLSEDNAIGIIIDSSLTQLINIIVQE